MARSQVSVASLTETSATPIYAKHMQGQRNEQLTEFYVKNLKL